MAVGSQIDTARRAGTPRSTAIAFLQAELASAAPRRRAAALRSPQGPFLRRDDELRILQENLEAVRAGGVRVVCLTGEPGAGKTTLLEHFIAGIQAAPGQLVTFSACSQRLAGAEAFLPLLDSLDGLTAHGEDAAITRLLRLTAADLVCADCSSMVHCRSGIRIRVGAGPGGVTGTGEA